MDSNNMTGDTFFTMDFGITIQTSFVWSAPTVILLLSFFYFFSFVWTAPTVIFRILDHGMLGLPFISVKSAATCKTGSSGKHQITYKAYVRPAEMDHDHKNMALGRPMSPHLEVYGPTVPAMTSIAERATGTILSFYALMLAAAPLFCRNGVDTYISAIQSLNLAEPMIFGIKAIFGWPFAFHYFIGIRFVLWNAGLLLDIKTSYTTAYAAILASFVLTIFIAMFV